MITRKKIWLLFLRACERGIVYWIILNYICLHPLFPLRPSYTGYFKDLWFPFGICASLKISAWISNRSVFFPLYQRHSSFVELKIFQHLSVQTPKQIPMPHTLGNGIKPTFIFQFILSSSFFFWPNKSLETDRKTLFFSFAKSKRETSFSLLCAVINGLNQWLCCCCL